MLLSQCASSHDNFHKHYSDTIMNMMTSQITGVSSVSLTFCSGIDQRKHPCFPSLAFVREIHWWPVNSHHKGPVTQKMFPFDDIIMNLNVFSIQYHGYWWSGAAKSQGISSSYVSDLFADIIWLTCGTGWLWINMVLTTRSSEFLFQILLILLLDLFSMHYYFTTDIYCQFRNGICI